MTDRIKELPDKSDRNDRNTFPSSEVADLYAHFSIVKQENLAVNPVVDDMLDGFFVTCGDGNLAGIATSSSEADQIRLEVCLPSN